MAGFSYSDITTLVTPGGTITFNAASGDTLFVDPARSTGLGMSGVRTTVVDKGQTDGYNVLPFFEEGQHLVLAGVVLIRSAATESGYVSARDSLLTTTRSKLKTILQADGTLNFGGGGPLTVRCEHLIEAGGAFEKTFLIGLCSATPA